MMMIGTPTTKEDYAFGRQHEEDRENRFAEIFHQMMMQDFRFMEAARIQSGEYEDANINTEELKYRSRVKELMLTSSNGLVTFPVYDSHNRHINPNSTLRDIRIRRFLTQMSRWPPFDIWAHWILESRAFSITMLLVILLSSMIMATEGEFGENTHTVSLVFETIDFFFILMFTVEIILKWMDNFREFWKDAWNVFDFFVTMLSFVAPTLDMIFPSKEDDEFEDLINIIKYIRIVRILRVLNVITRVHKIWIIWAAITRTFTAVVFITILILLFFYIFAIIGIQVFDRFTKTHSPEYVLRYSDRFSSMYYALITIFQIFTVDHWWPILLDMVAVMGYAIPVTYMLIWLLLGTIIFNNFFAGVMVNYFQNISAELIQEAHAVSETTRLSEEINIFGMDGMDIPQKVNDPLTDWETSVMHNLQVLDACDNYLSPVLWSRDTLFHFYVLLESLTSNLYERDRLLNLLNEAVTRMYE